jgi:hypothetical protein
MASRRLSTLRVSPIKRKAKQVWENVKNFRISPYTKRTKEAWRNFKLSPYTRKAKAKFGELKHKATTFTKNLFSKRR